MRELTALLHSARKTLSDARGWVWLVEITRAASVGGGAYRLSSAGRAIRVGSGDGKIYQGVGPNVLGVSPPTESADGAAGELSVTIPTVGSVAIAELEARAIQGQTLTIQAAHESDLANLPDGLRWSLTIVKAAAAEKGVKITAGHPLTFVRVPRRVFDASVAPVFAGVSGGAV